jgi:hypothetical protein
MVALHLKDPLQVIICFRAFSYFLVGVIIFGSVRFLSKKVTKPKFFFLKKKNRNRVKPNGFGSVRFFRAKTGSNRFDSVFSVWLGFGSVFPIWLGFFSSFLSISVRFFWFFVYKTETEPAGFLKKLIGFIGFFFRFGFFGYFFFQFSRFNRFSGFFAHPYFLVDK